MMLSALKADRAPHFFVSAGSAARKGSTHPKAGAGTQVGAPIQPVWVRMLVPYK